MISRKEYKTNLNTKYIFLAGIYATLDLESRGQQTEREIDDMYVR